MKSIQTFFNKPDIPTIDLSGIVDQLSRRGLKLPVLIRFNRILRDRLRNMGDCFGQAIAENEYQNRYRWCSRSRATSNVKSSSRLWPKVRCLSRRIDLNKYQKGEWKPKLKKKPMNKKNRGHKSTFRIIEKAKQKTLTTHKRQLQKAALEPKPTTI